LTRRATAGAVSLRHNGENGALLAMIHLQDSDKGHSEAVNFTNPGGKTTERHGAGLRLGRINNDPLKPVIAVRNLGDSATTVSATVPYSKQNGARGTIALPQLSLAPGEIKLLNVSNPQLRQNDFATAGLEIKYTGAPGSVIASATSVSQSGNHVFTLPMKDPKVGISSTGGYPWFIDGSSSTVVFVKNTTKEQQKFVLTLVYPGGKWGSNMKTLAPGETVKFDVREIRDSQMIGSEGNTVPLNAVTGHVSWVVFGKMASMPLIGRAQTVDISTGLVSTYECQLCCQGQWMGRLTPHNVSGFPGDQAQFFAQQAWQDCFGNTGSFSEATPDNWFTSDPNIATCNSSGLGTAINPGNASVFATWTTYRNVPDGDYLCHEEPVETLATALCAVLKLKVTVEDSPLPSRDAGDDSAAIIAGQAVTMRVQVVDPSGNVVNTTIGVSTSSSRTIDSSEVGLPTTFTISNGSTIRGINLNRVSGTQSGTVFRLAIRGYTIDYTLYTYFEVTGTIEGLVGGLTGCGHLIVANDRFVALPVSGLCNTRVIVANRATGASDNVPKLDAGPYYPGGACDPTGSQGGDPYWNTGTRPRVESQSCESGNNNAGIDLADGTASRIGIVGLGTVVWRFQ
jgi:hypothetical protein